MTPMEAAAEVIGYPVEGMTDREIAIVNAAVGALAEQGDITDADIKASLLGNDRPLGAVLSLLAHDESVDLIATVRALLARQAAVHATREAELTDDYERLAVTHDGLVARVAELGVEVEALRDRANHNTSRAVAAEACVAEQEAKNERLIAENERVVADRNEWRELAEVRQELAARAEAAEADVAALRATVERVRAIHYPVQIVTSASSDPGHKSMTVTRCACSAHWQGAGCRTLAALADPKEKDA